MRLRKEEGNAEGNTDASQHVKVDLVVGRQGSYHSSASASRTSLAARAITLTITIPNLG